MQSVADSAERGGISSNLLQQLEMKTLSQHLKLISQLFLIVYRLSEPWKMGTEGHRIRA